jgi:hypothetical protein
MDYWDQPLTFMITPKSGPLPQMSSLIDANRALTGNLPNGFLKRPHWLRAGQALVSAAETGKAADIEVAFESIVIALDEEGWLAREIPSAPPLSASSSDLGMRDMGDIEWISEAMVPAPNGESDLTVMSAMPPISVNRTDIYATVDTKVLARQSEEPLWRRILPNTVSLFKGR